LEAAGGLPWRGELEQFFEEDLSRVQVVAGPRADALLAHAGLAAAARGERVCLSSDLLSAGPVACRRVLAHEVAHVLQQTRGARWAGRSGDDPRALEREAHSVGAAFGAGLRGPARAASTRALGRHLQGHESFEHRLLGDTPTQILDQMVWVPGPVPSPDPRQAALKNACDALAYLGLNPTHIDAEELKKGAGFEIQLVWLQGSDLQVTYGELNTMADYLTSADEINGTGRKVILEIVQMIRQSGYNRLNALRAQPEPCPFGSILPPLSWETLNGILESQQLDRLTTGIGAGGRDHYQGVLARNACHFAPFTWWRWKAGYDLAVSFAEQAYQHDRNPELIRQAWLQHGYADHFLQDAFAAGHLINKTLIMQWFVDWAASQGAVPVADWDSIKTITPANQPGLWGQDLYSPSFAGLSNDPQTSEELGTPEARMTNTGIVAGGGQKPWDAYLSYLAFLDSPVCQIVTKQLHDLLNNRSVTASSKTDMNFVIWGDNTMLNGGTGAGLASVAAQLSQRSIREILRDGGTSITWGQIFAYFPNQVVTENGRLVGLQEWHAKDGELWKLCRSKQVFDSWKTWFIGTGSHVFKLGIVSLDQKKGPPFQPTWTPASSPAGWLTSRQCAACQWNGSTYVFYLPADGSGLACVKASDATDQQLIELPPTAADISFAAGVLGGQLTVVYADKTGTLTALRWDGTAWSTTRNYAGVTDVAWTKGVAIAQVGDSTYVMFTKANGSNYNLYYKGYHPVGWSILYQVPNSDYGSNPSLATDGQTLYVAFQHGDNGIYTGRYVPGSWTGPTSRDKILTTKGTSLAYVNGMLFLGYWAIDGRLHAEFWNKDAQEWKEMLVPAQHSVSPVTVAATFDGVAMLFAHGTPGEPGTLGWLPMSDNAWTAQAHELGAFFSGTPPLLVAYGGATRAFTTVNGAVYQHTYDGTDWSAPMPLELFVRDNGRLGGDVHVYNDTLTLWLASVRPDGSVQSVSFDGAAWTPKVIAAPNAGTGSVAIADYGGQLYAFYERGASLQMSVYDDDAGTWGPPSAVPGANYPVSTVATSIGDTLYLGYICADPGTQTRPSYTVAFAGQIWTPVRLACSNNASTVSVAGFAGQFVLVYLGTNGTLYGQWSGDGGKTWSIGVDLGPALTAPAMLPVSATVGDDPHAVVLFALACWPAGSYEGMFSRAMIA
jgi:hypothetical protein